MVWVKTKTIQRHTKMRCIGAHLSGIKIIVKKVNNVDSDLGHDQSSRTGSDWFATRPLTLAYVPVWPTGLLE